MPSKNFSSFDHALIGDVAECFHKTRRTVNDWLHEGCPRNSDGSFSIFDVHKWRVSKKEEKYLKGKGKSIQEQKIETDIEYKLAQIDKIRGNTIDKDIHEQILSSRAKSLSTYLETNAVKNAIHYVGKSLEQIQALRYQESIECLEAYLGKR